MSQLWYQDGLRFSCTRCGNCCSGDPGYVWVNEDEVAAIADFRGESVAQVLGLYTRLAGARRTLREKVNSDCVFLDRQLGCTIYPVRPQQCRAWPFWESNLRSPRAWEKTCRDCPGAGQGEMIAVDEISRRKMPVM